MIYTNKLINIKKNSTKKKKFLKKELKIIILKSLIQNNNLKPITRSNAFYKLSRLKYIYSKSKQNNNICLYSGKIKSVFNKFKMSRHFIKKFCSDNSLQNNKLINW
jgi:ribosomal protein S14